MKFKYIFSIAVFTLNQKLSQKQDCSLYKKMKVK